MLTNIEPTVRTAIMKILAAIYESGLLEEVDIRSALRLFGIPDDQMPDATGSINHWVINFNDPAFVDAYIQFKEEELSRFNEVNDHNADDEDVVEFDLDDLAFDELESKKRILH